MGYFLNLFTPKTWQIFRKSGAGVTGFRERHRRLASERVHSGDLFICYLTRLSRWCGVLQVQSEVYRDDSPIFDDPDPYPIRFRVETLVDLELEEAIPIYEDEVWNGLSITKQHQRGQSAWTGFFRGSLNRFDESDGSYLVGLLKAQQESLRGYPLTAKDRRQLARVRTPDREVEVEVPDHDEDDISSELTTNRVPATGSRESIRIQAKVAQIGAIMGFRIWVPKNDKAGVLEQIPPGMHKQFLEELPLNYDDTTLRTIEQIDVLWLRGRSMTRAFEIEHTTAIYSGLLRMADLLALQPNMDIRLNIVAPEERRERVLREIRRPVFSLLDRGPLYEQCSLLSYDSIHALSEMPHLSYMSDAIIAEYEESAEV
ncbi:MAG: hypothetical protein OXH85_10715 [Truepera sp.]|nr:hypothetical protein [Truepera sp.]